MMPSNDEGNNGGVDALVQSRQQVLRNANSSNYLNNSNPMINGNRLSSKSNATKSAADLLLLMSDRQKTQDEGAKSHGLASSLSVNDDGDNGALITPTRARFEFTKPLKHQLSNASMSSVSVNNLNLSSPSPIRSMKSPNKSMNSAERNAKYLSVIDLYDDDDLTNPLPSPVAPAAAVRDSLRIDNPVAKLPDHKESIYSPTSINSFNFVSKGFDDSLEELPAALELPSVVNPGLQSSFGKVDDIVNNQTDEPKLDTNKHKKQETLYYSPESSIKDIPVVQTDDIAEEEYVPLKPPSNSPYNTESIKQNSSPALGRSISLTQVHKAAQEKTVHKASSAFNLKAPITPVSFATTPSINAPSNLSGVSMNVTRGFNDSGSVINSNRKPTVKDDVSSSTSNFTSTSNVRNFINNNQSLLSLQTSRQSSSISNKVPIETNTKSLMSSDRDRYGFKKKTSFVSEQEYNAWWMEYEPYLVRRKKKWVSLMVQNGLNLNKDNPVRYPPKSNKLKRYVRKGIPAEWRGNAWWHFAKGDEKLNDNQGLYDKIVENTTNVKTHDAEIIERDLNRTFPDNIYFRNGDADAELETPLIQSLRRVLVAFATYQPQIGYCQSLNFLAGLLLIFLDEEKAFWMLVIITSRLLPGVHDVNLEGVNVDQGVLMLCIKEYLPSVWDKIGFNFESLGAGGKQNFNNEVNVVTKLPPITLCTAGWFMSAFIGILPIETCLRVWDCFFYEESKVFFRIGLSILKLAEPQIERVRDEMEVFQIIQNFPKKLIEPKDLFDCCFKKRNGFINLTQEEINRCRKFVKEQRQKASKHRLPPNYNANGTNATPNDNNNGQNSSGTAAEEEEIRKLKNELDENFIPDQYDFKKNGLAGVHWKTSLTKKLMKQKHKKTHT